MNDVAITIDGLGFGFGPRWRRKPVFADLSLKFYYGQLAGLCGWSGCGKSTLMRLVAGRLRPDAGSVCLHPRPKADTAIPKLIFVPQDDPLVPHLTVLETLRHHARIHGNRGRGPSSHQPIYQALQIFGLEPQASSLVRVLSGGEGRRLTLAAAWLGDPDILVLDEPTASLDPVRAKHVVELVQHQAHKENRCVILASHRREDHKLCDISYNVQNLSKISLPKDISDRRQHHASDPVCVSQ